MKINTLKIMVLEIKWPRMWEFRHLNSIIKRFSKSLRKEEQKTILILNMMLKWKSHLSIIQKVTVSKLFLLHPQM